MYDIATLYQLVLKNTVASVQFSNLSTNGLSSHMTRSNHSVSHPPELVQFIIDHLIKGLRVNCFASLLYFIITSDEPWLTEWLESCGY